MQKINFNNKCFTLLENSEEGTVNSNTLFEYKQQGDLITADYFGGPIRYGKIIALLQGDHLDMRYQCMTSEDELKSGKAMAVISLTENGKIKLTLQWEWLEGSKEKGVSEYLEN